MANPAISYNHPLATAQLVAGSETEDGPIQNIVSLTVATKWRSMAVPAFFTADLGDREDDPLPRLVRDQLVRRRDAAPAALHHRFA
jgi:hypothetical protein